MDDSVQLIESNDLVSAILLTVNRYEFLDEAIAGLTNQTYTDWELIIIQDGKNSEVTNKIESFVKKDSRINFYQRPTLNSIGSSINYAIKRAKGKYIAILDDDDIWIDHEKLAKQVQLLKKNAKINLTASWAYGIDKKGKRLCEIKKTNDIEIIKKTCLLFNPVIHSSSLFRKNTAISIDLYDESIPDYQDWDFALKMIREGEIYILQEFMIEYRMWGGNSSSNKIASMSKSTYDIITKHRSYFPNFNKALAYYYLILMYSKLPFIIRNSLAKYMSIIKKKSFNRFM